MTKIERQIKKYCDDLLDKQSLARCGKSATKSNKDGFFKRVSSYIDDPKKSYFRMNFKSDKLEEFVLAKVMEPCKNFKVIHIMFFEVKNIHRNAKFLKLEIEAIRKHFRLNKAPIRFEVYDYQKNIAPEFKRVGFKEWGYYLKGDVEKIYKKLQSKKFSKSLSAYDLKSGFSMRQFNKMMDLEFKAHKSDSSSVVHRFTRNDFNSFKPFFKVMEKEQTGVRVFRDKEHVGHLLYSHKTDLKGCANIATIAVHPKHQHRGIGLALYTEAVADMKRRRVKYFFGFTASTGVLKNAKKIGRVAISHIYELTP